MPGSCAASGCCKLPGCSTPDPHLKSHLLWPMQNLSTSLTASQPDSRSPVPQRTAGIRTIPGILHTAVPRPPVPGQHTRPNSPSTSSAPASFLARDYQARIMPPPSPAPSPFAAAYSEALKVTFPGSFRDPPRPLCYCSLILSSHHVPALHTLRSLLQQS